MYSLANRDNMASTAIAREAESDKICCCNASKFDV